MAKVKVPYGPTGEDGSVGDSVDRSEGFENKVRGADEPKGDTPDWLGIARDSYTDSTRFVESSLRAQWEKNERAFQSRHPSGSKYFSDSFKHRSKLYRPKTRAMLRQGDASVAASFFANEDVVSVSPFDDNDENQKASAAVNKELLQYRLTTPNKRRGIPWFLTVVGAHQDAQKYGVVVSKQWWEYDSVEEIEENPLMDPFTEQEVSDEYGKPIMDKKTVERPIIDRPRIDLIPIENVRLDRGCDWLDPINSSPYVILLQPMYIHEVEARMKKVDSKTGQPEWLNLSRAELKVSGNREIWDSTRTQREGNREDSKESETSVDEYSIVWVHENFMRWEGRDWVYYTAGIHALLSEPKPMEEVYFHAQDGERPLVMGYSMIEAHKSYPSGKPQLVEGLQAEANEVQNLRLDNVKLALNKRYMVKRGRQVDLRSLMRNSPGSVTLVTDKDDVIPMDTRDVTQSSYQEQDRINADYDDVIGNFSAGSVSTNRRMNETVGGMQIMRGGAQMIGELDLKVFTETWAEPVLRQVMMMEQIYEDNETVLAIAGDRAQLYQKYGIDKVTDKLLQQDLTVRVNVGLGATDPMQRLEKFGMFAKIMGELFGEDLKSLLDFEEISAEVGGALGYRDGKRFFKLNKQDPMLLMLQQEMKELQEKIERKEIEAEAKIEVARLGAQSRVSQQMVENKGAQAEEGMRLVSQLEMERAVAATQRQSDAGKRTGDMELEQMRGRNAMRQEFVKQAGAAKQAKAKGNAGSS